jgi:flagellar assembly protein FliH
MTLSRHQAVGAYRRWEPPAFDEAPAACGDGDTGHLAAALASRAQQPPVAAGATMGQVRLPTADEIETMFEQAREEGRAAGFDEGRAAGLEEGRAAGREEGRATGRAEGQEEARAEAQRFAKLVGAMDDALDRLGSDVADELVALAIAVARQMVGDTLAAHPEAVAATVREALQQLPQNKVRVHLNPADVALVREHLADQIEHGHHHLVEDKSVTRGGCVVEAAGCVIDASVQTRWRRIIEGLGRGDADRQAQDA